MKANKTYEIYQIDYDKPESRDYIFRGLKDLDRHCLGIRPDLYRKVYKGKIETENETDVLEELFRIFNVDHPSDFLGHSLSVSDVIRFVDSDSYYFCDSFGFKKIEFNNNEEKKSTISKEIRDLLDAGADYLAKRSIDLQEVIAMEGNTDYAARVSGDIMSMQRMLDYLWEVAENK